MWTPSASKLGSALEMAGPLATHVEQPATKNHRSTGLPRSAVMVIFFPRRFVALAALAFSVVNVPLGARFVVAFVEFSVVFEAPEDDIARAVGCTTGELGVPMVASRTINPATITTLSIPASHRPRCFGLGVLRRVSSIGSGWWIGSSVLIVTG